MIKEIIIVLVVILYWAFVYYPYHKRDYTPISIIVGGGILVFVGIYGFVSGIVSIYNILSIAITLLVLMGISFILLLIAIRKHGLKTDIDITLTWIKRKLGKSWVNVALIIAYPSLFFVIAGTYVLLGKEYYVLWIMIFAAYIISNVKLFVRYILN